MRPIQRSRHVAACQTPLSERRPGGAVRRGARRRGAAAYAPGGPRRAPGAVLWDLSVPYIHNSIYIYIYIHTHIHIHIHIHIHLREEGLRPSSLQSHAGEGARGGGRCNGAAGPWGAQTILKPARMEFTPPAWVRNRFRSKVVFLRQFYSPRKIAPGPPAGGSPAP